MSSPRASSGHDDPRLRRGMSAQLRERRRRLDAGERSLGWKVGFGTAAGMEMLGIEAPLTGFLTDRSLVESGDAVSLAGWSNPVLEPEIAVHLGADVLPDAGEDAAWAAVAGLGAAFELADVDPPPAEVEPILAGNIFQRAVVLGAPSAAGPVEELAATIATGGEERDVADPRAATGPLAGIVWHVAARLGAFDETLRAGEVVICGSIVPPIGVAPGDHYGYRLDPHGAISIRFRD
jgi:2-keto-4-pentenoate hydratase